MKKRKALLLVLCAILLVAASVMGTMAYLTSTDRVENTFTVGNVQLKLDEAKVDETGKAVESAERVKENSYKLLPGHTYTKDPTVTILAPSEPAYVRMKVTLNNASALIGICTDPEYADIETGLEKAFPEVRMFNFELISAYYWDSPLHPDHGTLNMEEAVNDPKYCAYDQKADTLTYTYYYHEVVSASGEDVKLPVLFEEVKLPEWVTGEQLAGLQDFRISVVAEAIQADGFENADAAWAAFDAQ